jgi:hypothetical protein
MGLLRKRRRSRRADRAPGPDRDRSDVPAGYNLNRDEHLYWRTEEGYLIAQDVTCQHEYIQVMPCEHCGGSLVVIAHLNRSGQGLSELVAMCRDCHQRANFIFDISNEVYQSWWADQLGTLYVQQYDGPPREPHHPD